MTLPDEFSILQEATDTIVKTLRPLAPEQRESVLVYVANLFGKTGAVHTSTTPIGSTTNDTASPPQDLDEFVFHKKADKDVERVVVLAYYLEKHRGQPLFKTADIDKLNFEAAGRPFGNVQKTVNNATRRNYYFAPAGNGFKRLTPLGRLIAEALPDKEKVASTLKEHKPPPKRKASPKKNSR